MLNLFDEKTESSQILSDEYLTEGALPPLVAVVVVAVYLTSCPGNTGAE